MTDRLNRRLDDLERRQSMPRCGVLVELGEDEPEPMVQARGPRLVIRHTGYRRNADGNLEESTDAT